MPADVVFIRGLARPPLYPDRIPEELRSRKRWVLWAYVQRPNQQRSKPPMRPDGQLAKPTDPADWSTLADCLAALDSDPRFQGVGYVLGQDDPYVAWDFDHVLDYKSMAFTNPLARSVVERLGSYTEVTPSGEGLHVWVRGEVPQEGRKRGPIECYQSARYITFTGNHWPGSPAEIRDVDCLETWREVFGGEGGEPPEAREVQRDPLGAKLWRGDWRGETAPGTDPSKPRWPSQSEADLALCRMLADACDGDAARVDELFRLSKLMRPKWDARARTGDGTYGAGTVRLALEGHRRKFHRTDLGNARRLASLARDRARYAAGEWYIWDGRCVARDETQGVYRLAAQVIEQVREEAKGLDGDRRQEAMEWAYKLESRSRIESMVRLAQAQDPLPARIQDFDARDDLFSCANGTMDELGNLREHRFGDLMTRCSPAEYHPRAEAPVWEAFLREVLPDEDLRDYVQRAVGYSMTGHTMEHKLFIAYGKGANGKSTFFEAVARALGPYHVIMPGEQLIATRDPQHTTAVADLRGARMALAAELPDGKRLNEDLVKRITGERTLKARRMHQDNFEFRSTAKLWVMTNYEPQIRGTDEGIWRRIHKIPFTVSIPKERQNKRLPDILASEVGGVLAWMVRGMAAWRERGLDPPPAVLQATEEYRREQDAVGSFLEDCAVMSPRDKERLDDVYEAYARRAEAGREFVMPKRQLSEKLREKGITVKPGAGNYRYCHGMKLAAGGARGEEEF